MKVMCLFLDRQLATETLAEYIKRYYENARIIEVGIFELKKIYLTIKKYLELDLRTSFAV